MKLAPKIPSDLLETTYAEAFRYAMDRGWLAPRQIEEAKEAGLRTVECKRAKESK